MKKKILILGLSLLLNGAIFGISSTSPSSQDLSEVQNVNAFDPLIKRQSHCSKNHRNILSFFFGCCEHGPRGRRGPRGHTGPPGPTGTTGPTGATGSTGATGFSLTNFISLYTLNSDGATITLNDSVPFNHTSAQEGSITSPTHTTITITQAGTYKVTFGIATTSNSESDSSLESFTLQKNDVAIQGGTYNNAFTTGLSGLTIDIVITSSDLKPTATLKVVYTFGTNSSPLITAGGAVPELNDPAATAAFIEVHQIL